MVTHGLPPSSAPRSDVPATSSAIEGFRQGLAVSLSLLARFGNPVDAVRSAHDRPGLATDGFALFPIKLEHHTRGYFKPTYEREAVLATTNDFLSSSVSEAIRNVYQHGHNFHRVPETNPIPGEVHAVVALKELSVPGPDAGPLKVLLAAVMDAGPGVQTPAHTMVDGVGNDVNGEQQRGMGVELKNSLVYVIRSTRDGWFAFDGHTYSKSPLKKVDPWSLESDNARIDPVGTVDLPPQGVGCQKIFFCPLKTATEAEKRYLTGQILAALVKPGA